MNTFKVVSDLICPWCYIGKRRLEAALRELPRRAASVSWHPFQLNPDMPREGMDRKDYCTRKFGSWDRCLEMYAQISAVGKTVGIEFRFDKQAVVPNTLDVHRVTWLAGRDGVQDAVVEALFRAYFCEGVNLASRRMLIEVVTAAGLEDREVERFLDSDQGIAEVKTEEYEVKSFGVSSVPLFIIQETVAVSGAQPPETLLKAFEQAQTLSRKPRRPARERVGPSRGPEQCEV